MPVPVCSLSPSADGVVCGDDDGDVWRLRTTGGSWEVAEAVQAVPPVTAVALASHDGSDVVVSGSFAGPLRMRDAADGTLLRNLRPVCESGVDQLVSVRWRSPGREPRSLAFSLSRLGVLEYWDVADSGALRTRGRPLAVPVPHGRGADALNVVEEETGDADALFLRAVFKGAFAVHDVARGPLMHHRLAKWTRRNGFKDLDVVGARVVRCGPRRLAFVEAEPGRVRVVDIDSRAWSRTWLDADGVSGVLAVPGSERPELLVVCEHSTSVFDPDALRFEQSWPRPAPVVDLSNTLPPGPPPEGRKAEPVHHHAAPVGMTVWHATLLPGGGEYAVAGGHDLAVLTVRGGEVLRRLELPSSCTGLAAGPAGGLAVGTRNGLIMFD